jgi:phage gp29-like protein
MLHRLLYNLVLLNYGEADAKKYTPKAELGAAEEADFKEQADGFVALKGAGILQTGHMEFVWAKLGLPKVEMDAEPMQMDKEGKPIPMVVPSANPAEKANPQPTSSS